MHLSFQPIAAKHYFSLPTAAGVGIGVGAGWLASAYNLPIGPVATLTGFSAALVAALVAIQAIGTERAEYWRYRRAALDHIPEQIEPDEPEEPEELEPGMLPIKRGPDGKILPGFANDVYIQDAEFGGVLIYNIQVSRPVLERLHEVVTRPRKDTKIAIVYDDFVRGDDRVFHTGRQLKKLQNDLERQHIGVGGRGNRFYLTERGRRVVIQTWAQVNNSPTARRGGAK